MASSIVTLHCSINGRILLTQRMAAAQLWLLRVLGLKFFANTVQQHHVALLRVLLESADEGPRHSARGLTGDLGILSVWGWVTSVAKHGLEIVV